MDVRILISAVDNASKVLDSVAGKAAVIGLGMERTGQSLATVGRGMQSVGDPLKGAIQSAMSLESEMADVAKVMGAQEVAAAGVGKGLMEMSRRIPTSVQGLAAISAAGGSLGIPAKEILAFTETAAKMGIAFGMSADQAGAAIAKMRNVFSLDKTGGVAEVTAVGDAINELSNNMAAKAPDIVEAMTRIGGTTRTFGMSAADSAALAASIISLGNAPDVAATAINSILPSLQTATGGTVRFKRGLESVGISAEEMEAKVKQNGVGAFQDLLKALEKLDPGARALAIKDMFGSGADSRALGTLANDATALTKALGLVANKGKVAGSMQREFAVRSETTANSMQLLQNNLAEIFINVGSVLLPAVNSVLKAIMPVVQAFASFAQANKGIVQIGAAALVVVAGLGAIIVALGTTISFVGSAIAGFGTLAGAWAAVSAGAATAAAWVASVGGIGAIAGSVGVIITTAFGAAVAAVTALGLPFVAVAAVIAGAAFLIMRNWKPISAFFVNLFKDPIGTFKSAANTVGSLFSGLAGRVLPFVQGLVSGASAIFGGIGQAIAAVFSTTVNNAIAPYKFAFDFLVGMFQGLTAAITPGVSGLSGVIDGVLTSVQTAAGSVAAAFAGISTSISQSVGGVIGQVSGAIGGVVANIKGGLDQAGAMFTGLIANVATVFNPVSAAISGAFNGVVATVAGVLGAARGVIGGFVSGVTTTIGGIAAQISGVMGGIASTIGGFVVQIASKIQGVMVAFSTATASGQSMGAAIGAALGQAITVISGIIAKVGQIPQAFLGIGSQIMTSINAIASQMFSAGANIIGQLIGGIQSKIGEATTAMSNAVGQMRAYLPFSPAKVGPLSDLDRVDFMGTLAQSITPAPMLAALQGVTGTIAGAMGGLLGALPAPLQGIAGALGITPSAPGQEAGGGTTIPATGGATDTGMGITAPAGGGGAITLNYSPTITIQGGATPAAEENFRQQLAQHKDEVVRIMADAMRQQRRVSYG